MNSSNSLYFKQSSIPIRYFNTPSTNPSGPQYLQSYLRKTQMYRSPDIRRIPSFVKSTNRKYFGAPPTHQPVEMKGSSILFQYTPKENQNRLLGSKSPSIKRQLPLGNEKLMSQSNIEKRQKPVGMYSSMIVGKSDQYKTTSALANGNQIKQLHNWADELKKKLLPFLDQQNKIKKNKEDLLNKYAPSTSVSPPPVQPVKQENSNNLNITPTPFSKAKKSYEVDYSKDFTDYSKFNGLIRQKTTQIETPTPAPQPVYQKTQTYDYSLPDYTAYSTSSFKKPEQVPDYSSSLYSTSSSYTTTPSYYSSYTSTEYLPQRQQTRKPLGKQDFEIGKKLGNGMFGEVFLVRHKTLKLVCAMKILKKSVVRQQKVEDQLVREIKIQFYLHHQNVINLYGFFCDAECVYLLQQLCMDGHLFNMLKQKQRFNDVQAADIIKQVCTGLDYIHRERIIHRDIKPQNIIMHMGVAKICDFGWAVYRGNGLRSTFCGTPLYTPPELLRGEMYDQKFDIWAIGILAYELIVGRFPFRIFCEDDLNRILTDEITFPFSVDVTPEAKNFILSIIRKDPRDRIQIDEILNHPFLRKNYRYQIPFDFKL